MRIPTAIAEQLGSANALDTFVMVAFVVVVAFGIYRSVKGSPPDKDSE